MSGIFISIEGPEGSGKSTHAERLIERLKNVGHEVVAVREPGGTNTGEAIRNILQHNSAGEDIYPETETLLFAACRAQLVHGVIKPALNDGKCVVSDRFIDSTVAYQGYGRGFAVEDVTAINEFAIDGIMPALTILLDVDIEIGFNRIIEHNQKIGKELDRMELAGKEFHAKVRNGYLELAKEDPERFTIIDSSRNLDMVADDIWEAVSILLKQKND